MSLFDNKPSLLIFLLALFQDSRRFIGITFDLFGTQDYLNISEKALERMNDFEFVRINALIPTERLQLALQDLICHSPKIRSLKWYSYQNICLPSTFNPEFLVELDMRSSKLRKLWEGTKVSDFDENFHFFF